MINIGDKVVCVDAKDRYPREFDTKYVPGYVENGKVYIVDGFHVNDNRGLGFVISGMPVIREDGKDVGWWADRFRKLEELKMQSELEYRREQTQYVPTTGGTV